VQKPFRLPEILGAIDRRAREAAGAASAEAVDCSPRDSSPSRGRH
jgi:hypothetical protein